MKKYLVFFSIVLLFPIMLSIGCSKKGGDTIKIGIAGPMTGDQSKYGVDYKNGANLAVEHWMAKGGVARKKVELVLEDDQHDPKQAVSVANKLVNEGIAGVVGHFNSSCSIPASRVYQDGGIVQITPSTTNPLFTEQGYWNVFRVCGRDDQQGKVGADFVTGVLKKTNVAVINDKTTYGQGITEVFKKNIGDKARIVYDGSIIQGDKDFKSVLTSVKSANPDVIYFGGMYPEAALLVKQAREIGLNAIFIGGDGAMDQKLVEIAGPSAEGFYMTFTPDPANIESAKGFIEEYTKKYGEPGPYSIYAFVATDIMMKAINETGSTDGKTIAAYIHKNSFDGPLGKVEFTDKGDNKNARYVVWSVKDGKFVQVTR